MAILRAKTKDLFASDNLTEKQKQNSAQNKKEIQNGDCVLQSYPARVVIELTSACNIRCIMCGRNHADFKPVFFDYDSFKKFEEILNHIEEVTLIGWGEPTMHPEFVSVLKYLNDFPVRKFICTNGMLLHKVIDEIFCYKVDLLTISLDGSTGEQNNKIRKGSDFERIVTSAKEIVSIKKNLKLDYPYLSTTSTLMKQNLFDFPNIVKLAGEIGFNEAKAIYLTGFSEDLATQSLYNCADDVKEVFSKAEEIASHYGINLKLPYCQGEDEAGDKPHKDCYTAWRDCFISADGYMRPCMSTPIKLVKITDYDNFFDFWNSDSLVNFRSIVNTECMPNMCKHCYQASYANWNKKHAFIQSGSEFSPKWVGED